MHLYIAYKNYSSWSLRPWLALKVAGIDFAETILPFAHDSTLDDFSQQHTIPAQVPVLIDEGHVIWDSLAIMEHIAECHPNKKLWPQDKWLRALARSAASEMHSSFMTLRSECPMNCRAKKRITVTDDIQADLNRLSEIWAHFAAAEKPQGQFLCGDFSIVDAMYAPVMWRIVGYQLEVSDHFKQWTAAMQALPAMQEWLDAAHNEPWSIESYEAIGKT